MQHYILSLLRDLENVEKLKFIVFQRVKDEIETSNIQI